MARTSKTKRLKKELGLLSVFALATGATLSSGFFLLPGLAYDKAGPAMVLCYMLAVIPLVPAMFSIVELSTAMPRAGGAYYSIDRSMGPLIGTISGIGTWLALILKTAFALFGMGAYLNFLLPLLSLPELPIVPTAAGLAVLFAGINLMGGKNAGSLQIGLVVVLLGVLAWFLESGIFHVDASHFAAFFGKSESLGDTLHNLMGTAGFVYISYVGVTKVASVSEEVKDPERNLPLGIFLAMGTSVIIYGVGTSVMVGMIPGEILREDIRPVATAARFLAGKWGAIVVSVAALCAFFAVANAGILSSSRYPLAMGRDHLMPAFFRKLNGRGMPSNGIYVTLGVILAVLFFLDVEKIAKLASAFQLLLFAFLCAAVIVMRSSGLDSYDPGFKSPGYPWMQILGIVVPLLFILEMGDLPALFSLGLIGVGAAWYFYYASGKVVRHGAIFHVFERLGRRRFDELDRELRGILKEKGLRWDDPYDEVIINACVLDIAEKLTFEEIAERASAQFAERLSLDKQSLIDGFLQGTGIGATPVSRGAALPHVRVADVGHPEVVIIRSIPGARIELSGPLASEHDPDEPIYAIFFLVSPDDNASQHLRILAQLARHIDDDAFISQWQAAEDTLQLKEILLREERYVSLELATDDLTAGFIGKLLKELDIPNGCLVALVRRENHTIVPDGNTVLRESDRLTIIGDVHGIRQIREYCAPEKKLKE